MNPAAPTTYRILLSVLNEKRTLQRELARSLNVSIGQVNKVFQWLEENAFVERSAAAKKGGLGEGSEVFSLSNPTGLLRAISLFRSMERLRLFTVAIDEPRRSVLADLRARQVVFCLGTALERFSRFQRADEVSFYVTGMGGPTGAEKIRHELAAKKEGITRVTCYFLEARTHGRRAPIAASARSSMESLRKGGIIEKTASGYFTTKVQTVVDFFCDGRAYVARDLLEELWGVKL